MGGAASGHKLSPVVVVNETQYVGDENAFYLWAVRVLRYRGKPANPVLYNQLARSEHSKHLAAHRHPHAFMDIAVGELAPVRVVFELFADLCPKTGKRGGMLSDCVCACTCGDCVCGARVSVCLCV